ncbi:MAG: hypothetical protein Q9188_001531 [Gyalolechia gomerana]
MKWTQRNNTMMSAHRLPTPIDHPTVFQGPQDALTAIGETDPLLVEDVHHLRIL